MSKGFSYEEFLEANGELTYTNVGTSMMPLLRQGRDLFTVRKKTEERCRAGDVVLYRRGSRYVLHRIVEVRPKDYVILGDNCVSREYGIMDDDILGIMTAYVRDGKIHTVDELPYRLYSAWTMKTAPVRTTLKKTAIAVWRRLKGRKNIGK